MGKLSQMLRGARRPYTAAVIVAGGSGSRFGGNKLAAQLGGLPVLVRTVLAFEQSGSIDEIVVAAHPDRMAEITELCRTYRLGKVINVVPGGETRMLSSYNGCLAVSKRAEIIAVHDGARPLVTDRLIDDAVWAAYRHQAAVPAVPVRDTIKRARERIVFETPERSELWAVQTPQCFQRDLLLAALSRAAAEAPDVTDDCAAVERIGGRIWLTDGSEENVKITTPLDLALAELILERRAEA